MKKHFSVIARDPCIGCLSCMFACSRTGYETPQRKYTFKIKVGL